MEIIISIAIAYILSGGFTVSQELGASPLEKSGWAANPTIGKVIGLILVWPFLQVMRIYGSTLQTGRSVAFGIVASVLQTTLMSCFVWACIALSTSLADGLTAQIVLTTIFVIVGSFVAGPLMRILMIPLTLVFAWPLDILFPLRNRETTRKYKKPTYQLKERPSAFDIADAIEDAVPLDVDLVMQILADSFPASNEIDGDSYTDLVRELAYFNIATDWDLRDLLDEQKMFVEQDEAQALEDAINSDGFSGEGAKRIESGVFHSWSGLARTALRGRFGEEECYQYRDQQWKSD